MPRAPGNTALAAGSPIKPNRRHCEEREPTKQSAARGPPGLDCFASLAKTDAEIHWSGTAFGSSSPTLPLSAPSIHRLHSSRAYGAGCKSVVGRVWRLTLLERPEATWRSLISSAAACSPSARAPRFDNRPEASRPRSNRDGGPVASARRSDGLERETPSGSLGVTLFRWRGK